MNKRKQTSEAREGRRRHSQLSAEPLRLEDDRWYTDKQTAVLYGWVHFTTIWRWASDAIIPKPVPLGPNVTRWSGRAIRADLESKIAKANRPQLPEAGR